MVKFFEGASAISLGHRAQEVAALPRRSCPCSTLRDRFDRHAIYSSLAAEVEEVADVFSDTALAMGALVKPVSLAGYEIAKPISKRSDAIRGKIAKALDFYSGRALAAAAARRANVGKEPKTAGG